MHLVLHIHSDQFRRSYLSKSKTISNRQAMSEEENLPAQCHPVFESKKKKKRNGKS